MYQTENEKTYVSGENSNGELGTGDKNLVNTPVLVGKHGENTYGIGAGCNNTYIIENTGNVYASRKQRIWFTWKWNKRKHRRIHISRR